MRKVLKAILTSIIKALKPYASHWNKTESTTPSSSQDTNSTIELHTIKKLSKEMIQETIREEALKWVGQEEIPGNKGWIDKHFEEMMKATGWNEGEAWCAYLGELVWYNAYKGYPHVQKDISLIFSASAVQTYWNFKKALWTVSKKPCIGALVIWQRYKQGKQSWQGHLGVCIDYGDDDFETVEGNTNVAGKREGKYSMKKKREFNFLVENGLRLVGFVYPKWEEIQLY